MCSARVAVLSTGGTIASVRSAGVAGVRASVPVARLLGALGPLPGVEIGPVEELSRVNSWNVDLDLMERVAAAVRRLAADPGVDGIVVTHGTDTLEETAFYVDVTTDAAAPVVFTAAMRSADDPDADGPGNLAAALRAAAAPELRGLGALVCLRGEVHAARAVRKWHTARPDAFGGPAGPLATIAADGTVRRTDDRPLPRWSDRPARAEPDTVPIVQAYTGMSPAVVRAVAAATGARGLVVEGFGLGHVPAAAAGAIRDLVADGVVVVVATRVPSGGTRVVYGGPGGGTDLASIGVLEAGDLSAAQARLLLHNCLAGRDAAAATRAFRAAVKALGRDPSQHGE
ncbi:asparaginase [Cryptosporangium japonicum]|uniref:asparaginase n=1 Tax=Cryptosporangium japonicum TaxID=80872 RepID=A0ABN0U044_9ACTN